MEPQDSSPSAHTDIQPRTSLILRLLPARLQPYAILARWDRPIGTWLLLLPGWWGLGLGVHLSDNALSFANLGWLIALMAIGAIAMRGAGCTWNDYIDRDIDASVLRTAVRPLPSRQVSKRQALLFILLQALAGLLVLLQFPPDAWFVAIASLPLVLIYPYMKRLTFLPQAWLGLTFNWGIWVGGAAILGIDGLITHFPAFLALYGAGIFWTLGYDTIYAHQDKEDDLRIGVKSTALLFQEKSRHWIGGFYGLMAGLLAGIALLLDFHQVSWLLLGVAGLSLAFQVWRCDFDDPVNCLFIFHFNRITGLLVALALIIP